jgi:hypothetical protein
MASLTRDEINDEEFDVFDAWAERKGLVPFWDAWCARREDGTLAFGESSWRILADCQRWVIEQGATMEWHQFAPGHISRQIIDNGERAAFRVPDGALFVEVRLRDYVSRAQYVRDYDALTRNTQTPYPWRELEAAIGPCPPATVTTGYGLVMAGEEFPDDIPLTRLQYAEKRAMRDAAQKRMPIVTDMRAGTQLTTPLDAESWVEIEAKMRGYVAIEVAPGTPEHKPQPSTNAPIRKDTANLKSEQPFG